MITPDILRFAQGELQTRLTESRLGGPHAAHPGIPLIIVDHMHTRLFAKIFIGLLGGLAVLTLAYAFTLPTPISAARLAQMYFGAALRIFCSLVATFWVVDVLQRRRVGGGLSEKDV
ncbi:MAG: hypothetical protein WAU68_11470 [Vitreimonas sp.]